MFWKKLIFSPLNHDFSMSFLDIGPLARSKNSANKILFHKSTLSSLWGTAAKIIYLWWHSDQRDNHSLGRNGEWEAMDANKTYGNQVIA